MEEAVLSGNLQRVEELIQSGVDVNVQRDVRGRNVWWALFGIMTTYQAAIITFQNTTIRDGT